MSYGTVWGPVFSEQAHGIAQVHTQLYKGPVLARSL